MAQNLAPSHWIDGYTANTTSITIPIASLDGLDAAEADASTGDIRKVLRALLTTVNAAWQGEDPADRPAKWTQSRSSSIDGTTSIVTRTFTHVFRTAAAGEEVVPEA